MSHFSGEKLICIRGDRCVFTGLDFKITPGEALVLVGPNGSGKSSLLRLMAGLLRPAAGVLAWSGEDINEDREAHNRQIHYVGHHDAVKPVLTVYENLAFWAGMRTGQDEAKKNLDHALDVFDIRHLADVPGRFLSAGQKRRVNLARVLAAPAPLWLLDEPTTALDKATIKRLEEGLKNHQRAGGMIVVSTHQDMNLINDRTLDLANFQAKGGPVVASHWEDEDDYIHAGKV